MGTFYLVKISRNFSSAVNGKRSLVRPTGKFSEKVEILRRLVPYGGPQLSRQNQKPRGKNKIPHGNTKNLTAKTKPHGKFKIPHGKIKIPHGKTKNLTAKSKYLTTKYLTAKPYTSQQKPTHRRQKQIPTAKPKLFCLCCEVFGFAVRFLVLLWGILFLPWGFWFCREVFCFCREVFGFAVTVVSHRVIPIKYEKSFVPRHIKLDKGLSSYLIPVPFVTNLAAVLVSCQVMGSAPYGGLQSNGTTFNLFLVFTWRHQNSN